MFNAPHTIICSKKAQRLFASKNSINKHLRVKVNGHKASITDGSNLLERTKVL